MDRLRQKGKKDKSSIIADVKSMKENLKIREILRTVKMNSSMRLKAPRGSKVMDNKDFIDSVDIFEDSCVHEGQEQNETNVLSATNPDVVFDNSELSKENSNNVEENENADICIDKQLNEVVNTSFTDNLEIESTIDEQKSSLHLENLAERQNEHIFSDMVLEEHTSNEQFSQLVQSNQQNTEQREEQFVDTSLRHTNQQLVQSFNKDADSSWDEKCNKASDEQIKEQPQFQNLNSSEGQSFENVLPEPSETQQFEVIMKKEIEGECKEKTENCSIENCAQEQQGPRINQQSEQLLEEPYQAQGQKDELLKCKDQSDDTPKILLEESDKHSETVTIDSFDGILDKTDVPDQITTEISKINPRSRKLSFDHTLLMGREGLSQSEVDLHSIGKKPLERKSSFFRKTMDSFLRNTTEMFKKQSFNSKYQPIQRKGSISISLQSLNERTSSFHSVHSEGVLHTQQKDEIPSSLTSLNSTSTLERSVSNVSDCRSDIMNSPLYSEQNLRSSQPTLHVTEALGDYPSDSVNSLNENYLHDSSLKNRAISMSSGLDSQNWLRTKKSSSSNRSKRVTWHASEGLANYFKRMIQVENSKDIQEGKQYEVDNSRTSEKKFFSKMDSKGRRLSYQRAVSGEDPVVPSRVHESRFRRKPLTDHFEENSDMVMHLMQYQTSGIPELRGYEQPKQNYKIWINGSEMFTEDNIQEYLKLHTDSPNQKVICELLSTEVAYIKHLQVVVNVFLATAHALQESGWLLDVDTQRLFSNIPDILNANTRFWDVTFHKMVEEGLKSMLPFDLCLMHDGFSQMAEIFEPYELYAANHPKAIQYLRFLTDNVDFTTYLNWCHSQKDCERLHITDLLVKPIQRVTKYNLILKRLIEFSQKPVEINAATSMDLMVKTYVSNLNKAVRKRQESQRAEHLGAMIDNIEVDYLHTLAQELKDGDMYDYNFLYLLQSNLWAAMLNCHPEHTRTVVHEGDLRFKDGSKEIEVRGFLFTDMLLICKKQSKGSSYPYKMIRPKYMIDKLLEFPKYNNRNNAMEMTYIQIVMVDDFGSCYTSFILSESSKDPNGFETLKLWDQKLKEAQYTYNLAVWLHRNPSYNINDLDLDLAPEHGVYDAYQRLLTQEEYSIEREGKERVATMMYRIGSATSPANDSHASGSTSTTEEKLASFKKVPGIDVLQNRWKLPFLASRNNKSSIQTSASGTLHGEYQLESSKPIYRSGSSVDLPVPDLSSNTGSSLSVNIKNENESDNIATTNYGQARSLVRTPGQSKLHINSAVALVTSLPDLSLFARTNSTLRTRSPSPTTAGETMYKIHKDNLKSRKTQYLTVEYRGTSYPPINTTRASLRRGLAFSYSVQKPTLKKMDNIVSQSQLNQSDAGPSQAPVKLEKSGLVAKLLPSPSYDKHDKEKEKDKEKMKESDKNKKSSVGNQDTGKGKGIGKGRKVRGND